MSCYHRQYIKVRQTERGRENLGNGRKRGENEKKERKVRMMCPLYLH